MKILTTNVYVGPNVYANFPVIRYEVDLGELENWPSVKLGKGFTDGLVEALPSLQSHGCSYREEGGFLRRLTEDEGTWIGHVWEHVAIELQNVAGANVTFGRTRGAGETGYNGAFVEDAGAGVEGLIGTVPLQEGRFHAGFATRYRSRFGAVPGVFTSNQYDATILVALGIARANADNEGAASFLIGLDAATGESKWNRERKSARASYSTPLCGHCHQRAGIQTTQG